jgi:hypothetical protein
MQRPAGQHVFNIISEHHRRDGGEYAPVQATSPQQEAATSAMRSQSLPGGTGKIMTLQKGAAGLKVLPVMLVAGSMIVFVQPLDRESTDWDQLPAQLPGLFNF